MKSSENPNPTGYILDRVRDTEQLRNLERRLSALQSQIDVLSTEGDPFQEDVIPPLVNLADNTDFIYSDMDYNAYTYADSDKVLAHWYVRDQTTSTAWGESTNITESAESITRASHPSPSTIAKWNTDEGSLTANAATRLGTRLHVRHASAGNYFAIRLQLSKQNSADITSTIKLKASLWDNTNNGSGSAGILRGNKPTVTSTKIGGHGGGTIKREYILEIVMPDGKVFYSETVTPSNVTNSVAVTSIDNTNYVSISWETINGSSRYNIYRRTPLETDTTWYLISSITNGSIITYDFGGTGGGSWVVPSFDQEHLEYQVAQAYYDNIGELIQTNDEIQEITLGLYVPYNYTPVGDQFLQLEFTKSDYTNSVVNTDIDTDGIRIDRVGLSYTNGRWSPSSRDLAVAAASITPDPPPSGGGGGEGNTNCVFAETPILIWSDDGNHFYRPAREIIVGDKLVSWDYKLKTLAPTIVRRKIKGISKNNYIIHVEGEELGCSFSHRVISSEEDFDEGTKVSFELETVMIYGKEVKQCKISAVETISGKWGVYTWSLSRGRENYIANGIFCHNRKRNEIEP